MEILVAYFSASGITKKVAEKLATATNADLFEIEPTAKYTQADLDWTNEKSRSTVEMKDEAARPTFAKGINAEKYDIIFLGFPIWWYTAPKIINTFLESIDTSNKKIILFATSGGSGLGNTAEDLKPSCSPTANIINGKVFHKESAEEIKLWAEDYIR